MCFFYPGLCQSQSRDRQCNWLPCKSATQYQSIVPSLKRPTLAGKKTSYWAAADGRPTSNTALRWESHSVQSNDWHIPVPTYATGSELGSCRQARIAHMRPPPICAPPHMHPPHMRPFFFLSKKRALLMSNKRSYYYGCPITAHSRYPISARLNMCQIETLIA